MSAKKVAARHGSIGDVDVTTDRLLVERVQAGDGDAFPELYAWYSDRVVRYCGRPDDTDDAEDAAQEAFVRAWRSIGSFGGDRNFYSWLQVIAHNVCVDWNRRQRPAPVAVDELLRLAEPDPSVR